MLCRLIMGWSVGAGLLAGVAAASAGMLGFRGDGGGVFATATCPTDFDGPSGRNIVWKAPLPNWGNGSPVVVGDQVFVVCEAATPATQDQPLIDTPLLLCFDAATGRERWRRPLDPFDAVPDKAQADRLRNMRREFYAEAHRQNLAGEKSLYANWQNHKPTMDRFAPYGFWDNAMWGRLAMGYCMPTPVSDGQRLFVFTGHRVMTAFELDGRKLWQQFHHEAGIPWGANTEYCGHSPLAVDGKVLMHFLIEGKGEKLGLRCYDAETGRVLWTTPTEQLPHNAMGSPQLLRLPKPDGGTEAAVFCYSGELIRVRDGRVLCGQIGYGKACAGLTGDGVDRIFMANGWHGGGKRKPDEPWVKGRFGISDDKAPLHDKQRLNLAVRFVLQGDRAEPQLLWAHRGGPDAANEKFRDGKRIRDNLDPYPVYHDGKLYLAEGQVWEAATGDILAWHTDPGNRTLGIQGVVIANGQVIGHATSVQDKDVRVSVTPLDAQGLTGATTWRMLEQRDDNPAWQTDAWKQKVKAETGGHQLNLWHGWHPSLSLPCAAGNRLFIRTFDYLWCIGAKN